MGEQTVRSLNNLATESLLPDLSFYFRIDPDLAMQRATGAKDRMEQTDDVFRHKVAEGYEALYQSHPERYCLIHADASVEQVHKQVINGFEKWVSSCD